MKFNLKGKDPTIDNIRKQVSDQQIYEFYLKQVVSPTKKYISPFREDKHPSMSFLAISTEEILWKDWGDTAQESPLGVVSFVMKLYNCSYFEALSIINRDMCLGLEGLSTKADGKVNSPVNVPKKRPFEVNNKHKLIEIEAQIFKKEDVAYWESYGITLSTLIRYNVRTVKYVWLNGIMVRMYSRSNPVYSYYLGEKDKKQYYKIYSPKSPKHKKWLTNAPQNIIQGINNLTWTDDKLIITKSLKDVMLLNEMGIDAVALQSETSSLEERTATLFMASYDDIYVLFDNDETGVKFSAKLCKEYNTFKSIFIKNKFAVKDISDFAKEYGFYEAQGLIETLIGKEHTETGLPF